MILADTSVWVDHIRGSVPRLAELLVEGQILMHPFVAGEIACGNLRDRSKVLEALAELPGASVAAHEEVLRLVDDRRLWGKGITWIDAHLLAAALITGCRLWTLDARLQTTAQGLKVDYAAG